MVKTWDVVTGGAGFIGSHLVDRLLNENRCVRVIDNFAVGHPRNLAQHQNNPHLQIITGDVADTALMLKATEDAERIFHLAARAEIVSSITHPVDYFRSNVDGTFSMLEAARVHQIKRFIYIASSSCYGFPDIFPTPETAAIAPRYPYALTKYLGEQLAMHWHQVYQLPIVSLRFLTSMVHVRALQVLMAPSLFDAMNVVIESFIDCDGVMFAICDDSMFLQLM